MTGQSILDLKLFTLQQKIADLDTAMRDRIEKDQALEIRSIEAQEKVNEAHRRIDVIIDQLEELRRAG